MHLHPPLHPARRARLPVPVPARRAGLLAILALGALAGTAHALSSAEVFALAAPAVAVLEVRDGEDRSVGSYSTTRVAAGRYVTACEVAEGAAELRLVVDAQPLPARIAARDRERNLCLLEAGDHPGPVLLRAGPPVPGTRVFAVSNALGLGVGISEGVVSGVRRFSTGDYVQFTAPVSPGSEGGALVDETGALVGILDYRRRDGQNVNFASLAAWVDEIEARAARDVEQLRRYDAASALRETERWRELQALAGAWRTVEPDSADACRFAVAAARGLGLRDEELDAWRALWRISPDRPDGGYGLGLALLAAGLRDQALAHARALVAAHREYAPARLLLGQVHQGAGQFREAEGAYREAIDLDPWLLPAYQGLGELARLRGDHATAISLAARLASLYPDAPAPRYALIQAYLSAEKPERAHAVLVRLPDKDKNTAESWYWRGVVDSRLGRPEAAVEAFRQCLARAPARPGRAWLGIGFAFNGMQRYPEAIAAFRAALAADPGDDIGDYQLAGALKEGGLAGEALERFQALTAKAPGEARYWRQLGFTLIVLGRHGEAVPALERSLQIDPAEAVTWAVLIDALRQLGRRDAALDAYEKLRAVDGKAAEEAWLANFAAFEEKDRTR